MRVNFEQEKLFDVYQNQKIILKELYERNEEMDKNIINILEKDNQDMKDLLIIHNLPKVTKFLGAISELAEEDDSLYQTVIHEGLIPAVESYCPKKMDGNNETFTTYSLPFFAKAVIDWSFENNNNIIVSKNRINQLEATYKAKIRKK